MDSARPDDRLTLGDRLLGLLLGVGGVATLSAGFAMLLPVDWMASIHRALGLGAFPRTPITVYLARSISGMYAIHGLLLLALSRDVVRYRPAIHTLGWGTVVLGVSLLLIDLGAPMPVWWTLIEGPPVALVGGLIAILSRAERPQPVD